jgi:hypothetical protein
LLPGGIWLGLRQGRHAPQLAIACLAAVAVKVARKPLTVSMAIHFVPTCVAPADDDRRLGKHLIEMPQRPFPPLSQAELKGLIDSGADIAIFDSRSYEEYHNNSIPTAISVPGAELVYRFADLTPSPDTTIIVNCGGPRLRKFSLRPVNSTGFQPTPTPSRKRPPHITSSEAACLATSTA